MGHDIEELSDKERDMLDGLVSNTIMPALCEDFDPELSRYKKMLAVLHMAGQLMITISKER